MIRLDNTILNEDCIEAIQPGDADGRIRYGSMIAEGLWVTMRSGNQMFLRADVDEAHAALAAVGAISPGNTASMSEMFTETEVAALRFAFRSGMRYAAKDKSGQVFVYELPPEKGEKSWVNDDSHSRVGRVKGDYFALSFDDPYPLDLQVVFGEDDALC